MLSEVEKQLIANLCEQIKSQSDSWTHKYNSCILVLALGAAIVVVVVLLQLQLQCHYLASLIITNSERIF